MATSEWKQWIDGEIDFEGQKLSEQLSQQLLMLNIVISFAYGYWIQSVGSMLIVYAIGYVITLFVCAPTWSFYTRNPVQWLPASTASKTEGEKQE
ncbi:signal peptidase complex, spc12 subunit [Syncephalis fuscata]|nr:signal peptidase complex, spc12 subunit [Syncephalis fuscata]